ncbi:MAG: AI-2E family transporter [Gammaproteobacteria bacterium]|nr:AI-2E family transporter [Gammaproteobacteria bacterium]
MRFLEVISGWVNRYFSNEEAIYLVVFLLTVFLVLFVLGGVLAPVLTGLVIAFLLEGLVKRLKSLKLSEGFAVSVTLLVFFGGMVGFGLFVVPLVWQQLRALAAALPNIIGRLNEITQDLSTTLPDFVRPEQVEQWLNVVAGEIANLGGTLLETLITQSFGFVAVLIYLILVPVSVFFFLKDRRRLMDSFLALLPRERPLLDKVGAEMNIQLANYVRGKFIEILIVGSVTYVAFAVLNLNYAALLALIVGLSVLIPFVGAAVVTIPVALVGIIQFGWTLELGYVMAAYAVIQGLDGNYLVPWLFSKVVDLHPMAIIVAVLAFGGLWGVWGVFFAIPLATLVKAIYNSWPRQVEDVDGVDGVKQVDGVEEVKTGKKNDAVGRVEVGEIDKGAVTESGV